MVLKCKEGYLELLIAWWGENSAKWELLARKPGVIFQTQSTLQGLPLMFRMDIRIQGATLGILVLFHANLERCDAHHFELGSEIYR